jgi:fructokinase
MRVGVDLGGTKIEVIALDENGATLLRRRVPSPTGDYVGIVHAIVDLVLSVERELGRQGMVGVPSPGAISTRTGLLKNSNSTVLNGKSLARDLSERLRRPVRLEMTQIALLFPRQSTARPQVPMLCSELLLARVWAAVL